MNSGIFIMGKHTEYNFVPVLKLLGRFTIGFQFFKMIRKHQSYCEISLLINSVLVITYKLILNNKKSMSLFVYWYIKCYVVVFI